MGSCRYVHTAAEAEVSCSGLATWVMPANAEPASIAAAEAKEESLQSMMRVGDTFVINVLEEGNYLPLLKRFQKSFAPGGRRRPGPGGRMRLPRVHRGHAHGRERPRHHLRRGCRRRGFPRSAY